VSEANQQPERPPKVYEAPIVEDLDTDGAPVVTPAGAVAGTNNLAVPRRL
jgi:hypothetical protein